MNYNTEQPLWENFKRYYPNAMITVVDGHLFCALNGRDIEARPRARFASDAAAAETLVKAGWRRTEDGDAVRFV